MHRCHVSLFLLSHRCKIQVNTAPEPARKDVQKTSGGGGGGEGFAPPEHMLEEFEVRSWYEACVFFGVES